MLSANVKVQIVAVCGFYTKSPDLVTAVSKIVSEAVKEARAEEYTKCADRVAAAILNTEAGLANARERAEAAGQVERSSGEIRRALDAKLAEAERRVGDATVLLKRVTSRDCLCAPRFPEKCVRCLALEFLAKGE